MHLTQPLTQLTAPAPNTSEPRARRGPTVEDVEGESRHMMAGLVTQRWEMNGGIFFNTVESDKCGFRTLKEEDYQQGFSKSTKAPPFY